MIIKRTSIIDGKTYTMDLDVTRKQIARYEQGEHLQTAFSNLTPAEREFIHSGITPERWDEIFGKESE